MMALIPPALQTNNKPCQSPLLGRDGRVGKNVRLLVYLSSPAADIFLSLLANAK